MRLVYRGFCVNKKGQASQTPGTLLCSAHTMQPSLAAVPSETWTQHQFKGITLRGPGRRGPLGIRRAPAEQWHPSSPGASYFKRKAEVRSCWEMSDRRGSVPALPYSKEQGSAPLVVQLLRLSASASGGRSVDPWPGT